MTGQMPACRRILRALSASTDLELQQARQAGDSLRARALEDTARLVVEAALEIDKACGAGSCRDCQQPLQDSEDCAVSGLCLPCLHGPLLTVRHG